MLPRAVSWRAWARRTAGTVKTAYRKGGAALPGQVPGVNTTSATSTVSVRRFSSRVQATPGGRADVAQLLGQIGGINHRFSKKRTAFSNSWKL